MQTGLCLGKAHQHRLSAKACSNFQRFQMIFHGPGERHCGGFMQALPMWLSRKRTPWEKSCCLQPAVDGFPCFSSPARVCQDLRRGRRWQRSRVGRAVPRDSQAEKGSFASWSVCAVLRRSWNHNYQSLGAGAGPAPRLGTTTLCTSTFVASPLNCSVPRHRQPWANPGAGAGTFPARY